MRTWTATTTVAARPEAVLDVLTDPDAVARWAPVPFDVDELGSPRLRRGSRARVSGRLAGRRVGFDVEVHEADAEALSLSAHGPVAFDVRYDLAGGRNPVIARCGRRSRCATDAGSPAGCWPRPRTPCSPPAPSTSRSGASPAKPRTC